MQDDRGIRLRISCRTDDQTVEITLVRDHHGGRNQMLGVHDKIGNKAFDSFSKAFNKEAVIDIGAASKPESFRNRSSGLRGKPECFECFFVALDHIQRSPSPVLGL